MPPQIQQKPHKLKPNSVQLRQMFRRDRALMWLLWLFFAMSVVNFSTYVLYSPCCLFALPCQDASNLLIALLVIEINSSYFSTILYSTRTYFDVRAGVQDKKNFDTFMFHDDNVVTRISQPSAERHLQDLCKMKPLGSCVFYDLFKILLIRTSYPSAVPKLVNFSFLELRKCAY